MGTWIFRTLHSSERDQSRNPHTFQSNSLHGPFDSYEEALAGLNRMYRAIYKYSPHGFGGTDILPEAVIQREVYDSFSVEITLLDDSYTPR